MAVQNLIKYANQYFNIIIKIIIMCEYPQTIENIAKELHKEFGIHVNSPEEVFSWIIDTGAVQKTAEKDTYKATPEALTYAKSHMTDSLLKAFIKKEDKHADLIADILHTCNKPIGTGTLEDKYASYSGFINENLTLSYFLSELEKTGALKWDNGWITSLNTQQLDTTSEI